MEEQAAWQVMLAVVAVRMIHPVVFLPAIAVGWFATAWWHGALAAIVIGFAHEGFTVLRAPEAGFILERAMLAAVAALVWFTIVLTARRARDAYIEGRERIEREKADKDGKR